MPDKRISVDTNVVVYLFSENADKADIADKCLDQSATMSVQVLNELTNVLRRKMKLSWSDVHEAIDLIQVGRTIEDITHADHVHARKISERYQLSLYDSVLLATAIRADCKTMLSEDMQHGLKVENTLTVKNPFI